MTATIQNSRRGRPGSPGRSAAILKPMIGERQSAFFGRAMRALRRAIPSVNRRTLEVLRLWVSSANDQDLRDKAQAQFPSSTFRHFAPRCVFLEHTVPASSDGRQPEMRYDREALQQMVDWANYRIRNSDTFSVISEGHTPTSAELSLGRPIPDALGYAGPFYLGQLGDLNPLWAIYADEWVHLADLPRYEKRQRRSPEVWVGEPLERRTMDPIAALGSETPRLDCGMNPYCRGSDGQTVMSYSAMSFGIDTASMETPLSALAIGTSPTVPGSFTFPVPDARSGTHPSSGEFTMPLPNSSPIQRRSDADGTDGVDSRALQQAVQQTVTSLMPSIMQTVQRRLSIPVNDASVNDDDADDDLDDDVETDDNETSSETDILRDLEATDGDGDPSLIELPDDELCHQYSAMSRGCQRAYRAGWKRGATLTQRYSRAADLHKVVARQQVRLQELCDQIATERRDATRYSKLNELSQEFAFDPREEADTCHDMTDKQFERHCTATIVKYARRDDVTNLELFTDPAVQIDRVGSGRSRVNVEQIERYSREAAAIAARKNAAQRGSTTFEAEFDAICKQHGVAV